MATTSRSRPPQPNAADVRRVQDEEAYPYIITSEIGKGSFATVFKGYHSQSRRAFAIKTISRAILTHKLLDNLESEIAILKALSNKHITELVDIVKAPRNIYLIMEYCSGGDLSHYIRHRGKVQGLEYVPQPGSSPQYWPHPKSGGLDPVVVKSFLGQLAYALKFLRDRNLIHRDIKPQNLLLEPSTPADAPIPIGVPVLKIADFGFARSLPNAALAETLCGSPLYMAPEILRYEKYDAKADLWSVGAVLYEMSVGKPPFRAQNHMELLKKIEHARGRVSFPDEIVASRDVARGTEKDIVVTVVPPEIKTLIRMLLKRKPIERASFDEFFASEAVSEQFTAFASHAAGGGSGGDTPKNVPTTSEASTSSLSVVATTNGSSSTAPSKDGESTQPSSSSRKHRDKSHRDRDNGEPPLEGTPYDPKLYTPQTTLRFRRSHHRDETLQPVAGPSTSPRDRTMSPITSDKTRTVVQNSLTVEPSLLAYPTAVDGVKARVHDIVGPEESINGSRRDKEYVLVGDTRAVEFDRVADQIDAARKRPPTSIRTTSTGARGATATAAALGKQVGRLVIGAAIGSKNHQQQHHGGTPPITIISPSTATVGSVPSTPAATATQIPTSTAVGQPLTIENEAGIVLPSGTPPFATNMKRRSTVSSTPATPTTDAGIPIGQPASGQDPQTVTTSPVPIPMTFPPPPASSSSSPGSHLTGPNAERMGYPHQPNALVRAINMASKALFGSPANGVAGGTPSSTSTSAGTSPSFPHSPGGPNGTGAPNGRDGLILKHDRPSPPSYPGTLDETKGAGGKKPVSSPLKEISGEAAAVEDAVLAMVEEIAQKAQVLRDYADKKFSRVEAVVAPSSGVTSNYPSLLTRRRGEPAALTPGTHGLDDRQRKKQLDAAEQNAVQSIALYIAVMAFSQKGINALNKYCQQHLDSKDEDAGEWSSGVDDALAWFRETFKACVERSEIMKAWLPEGHQSPPMWIDRVVYDHALALMRQAASKEILEDNYAQIERDYERALWMLYAIADDVIQEENPYSEQDIQTINGFIDTTKARLMRLRRRIETKRAATAADAKNQTQANNGLPTHAVALA